MKGKPDSGVGDSEKHTDNKFEEKIDNVVQKIGEVSMDNPERRAREPSEDADFSDEKINNLSDIVSKLNITTDDDKGAEVMKQRGPTGGTPVYSQLPNIANKVIPMGPIGNYIPPQHYGSVHVPQKKGARSHDDEEDLPAHKYFNPGDMNVGFTQQPGGFMNNLGQTKPPMMNPNFQFGMDPGPPAMATSQMTITGQMSGGKVTVTSPISNLPPPFSSSIADDFLDKISPDKFINPVTMANGFQAVSSQNGMAGFPHNQVKFENATSPPSYSMNINNPSPFSDTSTNDFTGPRFDWRNNPDIDSGLESAEERSPYSDPAPSPSGSTYTSPPSVDSGCGRSPMHESAALPGMSPPKYVGINSPANTSGYGSPEMPQIEDTKEFLDPNRLDELDLAYEVINDIMKKDEDKKIEKERKTIDMKPVPAPVMAPQTTFSMTTSGMQPVNGTHVMHNFTVGDRCVPVCVTPQTTLASAANPVGKFAPTTSGSPQQIIILPPAQAQPQILVLQQGLGNTPAKKNPTKPPLRKILPKMPQTSTSAGNNGGSNANTHTTSAIKSEVTMTPKMSAPTGNRNGRTGPNNPAQNKLLMMARRTVAAIERENLKKFDEEGDTYLHIAVCKLDKNMVQALLERLDREGLNHLVDQENNKRQTPLYLAVFLNQPVMVHMFIRFQADVNVLAQTLSTDRESMEVKAAIHVAASHGSDYLKTLEILLSAKNISINIVNNCGQTALHCAILAHGKPKRQSQERINSVNIIKALIKAGADPSAQDKKSGKTPLMYAIEQRNLELVEAILTSVDPSKVRNVVKTQAFDGSSCLRIAEGLRTSYQAHVWNKLWNSLHSAANGSFQQIPLMPEF